jgi:hypothetical protein
MARQRGLRASMDRVEGNAHYTMNSLRSTALELIEELEDGITIRITKVGEGSVMDFLMGRLEECPIGLRIDLREDDEGN